MNKYGFGIVDINNTPWWGEFGDDSGTFSDKEEVEELVDWLNKHEISPITPVRVVELFWEEIS